MVSSPGVGPRNRMRQGRRLTSASLLVSVLMVMGLLLAACGQAAPAAPAAAPKASEATKPAAPAASPAAPAAASPAAASSPAAAAASPAAGASPAAAPAASPAASPAAKPAGAGAPSGSVVTGPSAPPPVVATAGKPGGTAIVAIDADPETLNLGITTGYAAGDVGSKIFEGLVWTDHNFNAQPALAASWTVSADGKEYTFKLRPNVKWHDGKPFTSADVKFSFEEILAKLHPRAQTTLKRLQSIETPDPLTVTIKLSEAYAPFLLQQTAFDSPILPKHVYEGSDPKANPANQSPIGTGPFKFAEWNRGSSLKVVRNTDYWDAPKPYLDALVFQIVPQGANRSAGLETGEIDFVVDFYLPKADVGRLSTNQQLIGKRGQGTGAIDFMMMNQGNPVLARKEVRQALAFAINRETQVQQAMGGLGRPGFGPLGDAFKWLVNDDASYARKYPLDVEKAKALLTQAGVAPNTTLRLVHDAARPNFVAGAQIIRDNLRQVGITVEIQPLERSVMIQKVFAERDYDLTLQSFVSSGDPSIGYHRLYLTNETKAQFVNATGYSNAKVDELLNKAAVTPGQADRAALYKEAQAILSDEVPSLVLYDEEGIDFASKKLNNVWLGVDSRDRWGEVWLTP
ncbi:MAG: ABC transporter substrate-binding protein [Chloroflexi bacterium]|nr:ABC transporter substrate-binding protein [Chloroflexota bacterium]